MNHSPIELLLRIDWSELDLFKHVNNVSFFKYIQAARVNYWEHKGIYKVFTYTGKGPMVVSVSCQFKKPLFYPGEVKIVTTLTEIGNTSFGFEHQLYNSDGELCAEAKDTMVYYDFNIEKKIPFPAEFR